MIEMWMGEEEEEEEGEEQDEIDERGRREIHIRRRHAWQHFDDR